MKAKITPALLLLAVSALSVALVGCGSSSGGGGNATATGIAVDDGTMDRLANAVARIGSASSDPTGADGIFTVNGGPTGTHPVTVSASDHRTGSATVTLRSGANNIGLVYLPPILGPNTGAVTGIMVLAGSGRAVDGGTVRSDSAEARSRSDGTGRFTIYGVKAGAAAQITFLDAVSGANAWRTPNVVAGQTTNVGTVPLSFGPPPPWG